MKIILASLCALVAASASVHAQQYGTSSVRQAAIERLQSKLGNLRGTLEADSDRVFLTRTMIDQLKPIPIAVKEVGKGSGLQELKTATDPVEVLAATQSSDGMIAVAGEPPVALSEVYRLAGLQKQFDSLGFDFSVTNSAVAEAQSEQDVEAIMKLADDIAARK